MRDEGTGPVEAAIRELREGRPFLPVAVVVPSHLPGSWLRPRLFAETGHLGIDFVLLPDLAWRVVEGAALAEGLGPVPESVDLALALAAAAAAAGEEGTPEFLKEAVGRSGFGPALLRTAQELAAGGVGHEELERLAERSGDADRLRLLARSVRGLRESLAAARLLDRPSIFERAAAALPSPAVGGVVLLGLDDPAPAAAAFVEALRRHHPVAMLAEGGLAAAAPRHEARQASLLARLGVPAPAEAGSAPSSSLERLQRGVFVRASAAEAEPALDDTVRVLAAAGEGMEAVEIARLAAAAVREGVRPREIAVLVRDPGRYAVPLASAFDRAGLPAFFADGEPRVDPAARSLGLLLGLLDSDLDRRAVMEFLTTAQVPWEALLGEDAEISAARWDRLSAEAGIVSGLGEWRDRLAQARAARAERGFEDDRDLRLYDSLLVVVERLASDLGAFPGEGGWDDYLGATLRLLEGWIQRGRLVHERLERVIGPLGRFGPRPKRAAFLERVRELLASQVYREGSIEEERVLVSSIASARGLRFRVVFVPGLVERAFPAVVRPDPLLLDDEREALSPALRTTRDGQEAERLHFVRAVRAAGERLVLSYPRFDTGTGRERVPSSFLLEAVEAALGRRAGAAELLRLASAGATGLGRPHPEDPALAIDALERDLAAAASGERGAARYLLGADGFVAGSVAAERAAWEPRLTPFDGLVDLAGDDAALQRLAPGGRTTSATDVQRLAACPYQHLLKRGFRLEPWEDPDHVYQLSNLDFGSLYHAVAHRLFGWMRDEGLLPLAPERVSAVEERLRAIVDEEAEAVLAAGRVLNAALLAPAKAAVRSAITELVEREAGEGDAFVPARFEQRFEGVEVPLGDGRTVAFNGSMDRVDEAAAERRLRVIDYKTGQYRWKEGEQFRGGRELQLAIYNVAAARLVPEATVDEALYYFATPAGRYKTKACPATAEAAETLASVLRTLDATARAGTFAPVADSCDFCDYQGICGQAREARAERKKGDPRLGAFQRMRAIP